MTTSLHRDVASPFPVHPSRFTAVGIACCVCIALLAFAGCKPSSSVSQAKPSASPVSKQPAGPKLDACTLLTKDEILAVQGSTLTDTKSSEGSGGAFRVAQCYFATDETNRSVSLAVTQTNREASVKQSVRDYWKQAFGRFSDAEKKEEEREAGEKETEPRAGAREREEEERQPPKKIEGVGEQAFWAGNRFGGALYVLKNENMIRISVGGPDNEEGKINKSKTLAEKVLSKL